MDRGRTGPEPADSRKALREQQINRACSCETTCQQHRLAKSNSLRGVCLSVSLSLSLSGCPLSVSLPVCLSLPLPLSLRVSLSLCVRAPRAFKGITNLERGRRAQYTYRKQRSCGAVREGRVVGSTTSVLVTSSLSNLLILHTCCLQWHAGLWL